MSKDDKNIHSIDNLDGFSDASFGTTEGGNDLQKVLDAKSDECTALNEKYLRLAAEFDNYKRLAQRDQRDQIKFGNEQILKELLPVVDNLERAIKSSKEARSVDTLTEGVELTLKQLVSALTKFGVKAVESVGLAFDPATQQAVAQVASDTVPENHVVEEYQKGYLLQDRILRAAMVTVSTGAAN
ncbi:MAG: nucleotide exchange factor GrpE [Nitrospira sp.]|jgi:molecular chaperone GrpE|nr:nucleotide exchange factor GrpE [Nitrospira sp.]MBP6606490.1 nucleotide exchange factor GrpE [Nitrospira sp.]MCI1278473.1 nucleotide exchange factor GrpE [Nitrospira sp.]HQY57794.1 nucleotide exchange factor GrpE [Nitrospira sp.]HRA97835.1 nucleotide exchange factor GrpE [Nitrospira sp.]